MASSCPLVGSIADHLFEWHGINHGKAAMGYHQITLYFFWPGVIGG
jgi:hypothetical protein